MTVAGFKAYVASVGATLDEQSERQSYTYVVDAPVGKQWAASFGHSLVSVFSYHEGTSCKPAAIKDIVERMKMGYVDCTDAECDFCHPVEEDLT